MQPETTSASTRSPEDFRTQAKRMVAALRTLKPNRQRQTSELFSELYPVIAELLRSKVTQKAIIEQLAKDGLKLHPARFKELLAQEAKLRDEQGNRIRCDACGALSELKNVTEDHQNEDPNRQPVKHAISDALAFEAKKASAKDSV
jgi:hypothetical protein